MLVDPIADVLGNHFLLLADEPILFFGGAVGRPTDIVLRPEKDRHPVRADCLATNTEYCDRCTHAATQATNVARIKTEGTKGLLNSLGPVITKVEAS